MTSCENQQFLCNSAGVIDVLGASGGLLEFKASLLASYGFAALALAHVAYDDLPANPPVLNMDYFEEAANWLSNHPKVLPHGIGVHSMCFGSLAGLLMASLQMKAVKAVVAISPLVHAYPKPFEYRGKVSELTPFEISKKITTEEGIILRYGFPTDTDYDTPISKYPPLAPVEDISCPVLVVLGTDDLLVNADFSMKLICDRLRKNGKENLCSVLRYPGAGHIIDPPYSPHCYANYVKNIGKWSGDYYLVKGGDMKQHARAQEDAWPKILRFLKSNLVV